MATNTTANGKTANSTDTQHEFHNIRIKSKQQPNHGYYGTGQRPQHVIIFLLLFI